MSSKTTLKFRNQTYVFDDRTGIQEIIHNNPTPTSNDASIISKSYPMKKNYPYCSNCHKVGHIFRNCRFPTNSYGCVLFKRNPNQPIRYLMIQRKYTPAYVEILRAKYYLGSVLNFDYLVLLIKDLPLTERHYLLSYDFSYLRQNLWKWEGTDEQMKCLSDESIPCAEKFQQLKVGFHDPRHGLIQFQHLFEIYPTTQLEPDWEFPKGHRIDGESDQLCAMRECLEETRYQSTDYKLFLHVKPFQEKFIGINQVKYCNSYYLGELITQTHLAYYDPTQIEQNKEIRKIGWFTEPEIRQLVNVNHKHRFKMLTEISKLVQTLIPNQSAII